MTIKEITALRKSGQLQKALEAAKSEFERNANKYTVSALFWCLYDFAKQQSGEELASTFDRMKSLYSNYCVGDELMQKALSSISRMVQNHFQELKDALEKAKRGDRIYQEYQYFLSLFKAGDLDATLFLDFGWLIYYALKQTFSDEQIHIDSVHIRKEMLSNYLALELQKPSMLHSLILTEAIKVEQNTPLQFRIRDFIRIWGLENLREEDWEQYRTEEGNTLPSTVEKLIGVYTKELKTDGVESPDDFDLLVDKALAKYPKNQNMPYFKATVLISQGKSQEALTYYKNLILQFPSKFYLWNQTVELVEDIDTRIGLLCKALTCGADDEFLGGVRLRLASLLYQKGMGENAKYELERYRETYQNNRWNLKPEFWQVYNQVNSVETAVDNNVIYAEFAVRADEFIYSSLPTVIAVKVAETKSEDRNHPGRKITTWVLRTSENVLRLRKPTKFGLRKRVSNGVVFEIKIHDGKIVWIKEHIGNIAVPWLKQLRGKVHLRTDCNGKKYAIVAKSYIGEGLLKAINEGQEIKFLSIQQKDGRWSAISLF